MRSNETTRNSKRHNALLIETDANQSIRVRSSKHGYRGECRTVHAVSFVYMPLRVDPMFDNARNPLSCMLTRTRTQWCVCVTEYMGREKQSTAKRMERPRNDHTKKTWSKDLEDV
mmetsp:Transcript_5148/g.5922  ORF Transcript_5148/g.5922 Transcript_5148/m.5922 type:complete len:115 (-) Transcript_5148:202-546(-)